MGFILENWDVEGVETCVFSAEDGTYMLDFLSLFDGVLNGAVSQSCWVFAT